MEWELAVSSLRERERERERERFNSCQVGGGHSQHHPDAGLGGLEFSQGHDTGLADSNFGRVAPNRLVWDCNTLPFQSLSSSAELKKLPHAVLLALGSRNPELIERISNRD